MSEDYLVRYYDKGAIRRTFWNTLTVARRRFAELKKNSSCQWAEILFKPIDTLDKSEMIESFNKDVVEILGQSIVINL